MSPGLAETPAPKAFELVTEFTPGDTFDYYHDNGIFPSHPEELSLVRKPANLASVIQFCPAAEPGVFTRKLIALMKLVMRRNRGKEESTEGAASGTAAPDAGGGGEGPG